MAIIRWDPFKEILDLRDEIDRIFSETLGRWPRRREETAWVPPIDVSETDNEVIVKADLPGLSEKDVEVLISGNYLTIKGERKREKEVKGENFYRVERVYGSFERSLELPAEVNPDKAKAQYKNGVLTITIPKTAKAKVKSIKIETESEEKK